MNLRLAVRHVLMSRALAGVAAAVLAAPGAARAEERDPGRDRAATSLGEIVVTANKREERLQDVAMSVAAISGEELQRTQAFDLQDLATKIGGLNLQQGGAPGLNRIIIRGQNSGGESATVATMIDDIPLSFSGANTNGGFLANDFDTYDLSRVEVLRGPQGTLYGATAEGGLVKYVTTPPDRTRFAANVEATAVDVAEGGAGGGGKAFVNVPLADGRAALRVNGYYDTTPGWVDNRNLGQKDLNELKRYGGRAALLWQINDRVAVRFTALLQSLSQDGNNQVRVRGAGDPAAPFALVSGYDYSTYTPDTVRTRTTLYGADVTADLGFAELQSITSFGRIRFDSLRDVPSFANAIVPGTSVRIEEDHELKKYTQELRLASHRAATPAGGSFDWLLGALYTREDADFVQDVAVLVPATLTQLLDFSSNSLPNRFTDKAVFADGTYHLTTTVDVQAGVRVSRNDQRTTLTQGGLVVGGGTLAPLPNTSQQNTTTYQIAPRWRITPALTAYARVATGYRPGGPQLPIFGAPASLPTSFKSDRTTNYELGLKGTAFDGAFSFDVTAYRIDWKDIQILTAIVVNGTTFTSTGNAGTAKSQGAEWSFDWTALPGLRIGLAGAYTDATLTRDAPLLGARSGQELPFVPSLSNTLSVDYDWTIGGVEAFIGGSWTHTDERFTDFPAHDRLPGYATVAAQAGVRVGRYSVQLFGKNLSNERGLTGYGATGAFGGTGFAALIRPRIVGLRVTADF